MYYLQSVSQFFSQGVVKEGRSQEARLPFEIFKRHRFLPPQTLFDANYRDNKSKNRNFPVPRKISRDNFSAKASFLSFIIRPSSVPIRSHLRAFGLNHQRTRDQRV